MFDKILIANRGEIACRVMRTAREMGVGTVAVYSDADAQAQHTLMADESYNIGPPPAAESYLLGERILEVAQRAGAQAVHPGYGFLSENEQFSAACKDAGVVFIGPPEAAIHSMGSKSASKEIMIDAGVPVTPGYHGEDQSMERLQKEADDMGYPVMIKAVLGGGGKGMRIVHDAKGLREGVEACQREARASFGDDRVLIERYLTEPRHIELQIFADTHGNAVHLFERDCSVQRRHQKVLEEAPAPFMTEELRARMGGSAVDAARAVGYVGAGTVEFMLDHDGSYYFMEMNTRLQVEHPVTEMVTRQDLVQWQLLVAAGHPLPLTQDELKLHGHAIEARVYAENPLNDFLPAAGPLKHLRLPRLSDSVRVDTGVVEGDNVSTFYDPMISKLICWGKDRPAALRHLSKALEQYQIVGIPNNVEFLHTTANHPAFQKGGVDTSFLNVHLDDVLPKDRTVPPKARVLAALARVLAYRQQAAAEAADTADPFSPWASGTRSRPGGIYTRTLHFLDDEEEFDVTVKQSAPGSDEFVFSTGDDVFVASGYMAPGGLMVATVDGISLKCTVVEDGTDVHLFREGAGLEKAHYQLERPATSYDEAAAGGGAPSIVTPMPGKIVQVALKPGDAVEAGDKIMILEAMKMEHVIRAPAAGVIADIHGAEGDFVEDGTVLVVFETEGGDE